MHSWGDSWPHWNQLHESISRVMRRWERYGRIGSHGKEKWGEFRHHPCFFDGTLFTLLYPGYVWIPKWYHWTYFNLDSTWVRRLTYYSGIWFLITRYQRLVYELVLWLEVRKYPEIKEELLIDKEDFKPWDKI